MDVFQEALEARKEGKNFAIATIIKAEGSAPRHESSKMIIFEDGSFKGTIGGGILEKKVIEESVMLIKKGESKVLKYNLDFKKEKSLPALCGGEVEIFVEVFKRYPKLILVGGGHVNLAIYNFARFLQFDITVIDDREEWANENRFGNVKIIVDRIPKALEECPTDEDSFIVIATRGHVFDKEALKVAIRKKAKYVGMIGSRNKVKETFEALKREGYNEEELSKVYSPVGLDIGAETPEEIALSVLAEILKVKNDATGVSMKLEWDIE